MLAISLYFFVDMPSVMIVLFLLLYSLASFASGLINPVWLDMLAKIIPERRRGRLFGLGFTIGKGLGILGSLAAGYILDHYGSIKGFTLCFFFAFLFNCVSWICMALIKEPRRPVKKEIQNITTYLYQLPSILQKNRNFSLFLLARVLSSFYGMAAAFFTVYAISRFNATHLDLGMFTALLLGSGLVTNFFWGYLGDKKGHKIVLVLACLLGIFSIPTAVFAGSLTVYYIVFAIYGTVISANMISGMSIILEFADHEDCSTYVALNNLVISPVGGTASLLGGFLANYYNYPTIFLMTMPILMLGLTLMLLVKDPRSMHPE